MWRSLNSISYFFGSNPQFSAVEKLLWELIPKEGVGEITSLHYWARLNAQLGLFILGICYEMWLLSVATTGSRKTVVKSGYQAVRQGSSFYMFWKKKSLAQSWWGLSFSELTELTCRRKIKKNEFNFFPFEKVCLLEWRIHSPFRGTFDQGLHRKLEDENSTFALGGLMIEKPVVSTASEVRTAAESASQQACTLQSGLLHDWQFSSLENKNRLGVS